MPSTKMAQCLSQDPSEENKCHILQVDVNTMAIAKSDQLDFLIGTISRDLSPPIIDEKQWHQSVLPAKSLEYSFLLAQQLIPVQVQRHSKTTSSMTIAQLGQIFIQGHMRVGPSLECCRLDKIV